MPLIRWKGPGILKHDGKDYGSGDELNHPSPETLPSGFWEPVDRTSSDEATGAQAAPEQKTVRTFVRKLKS